jgi:hypothetical protein
MSVERADNYRVLQDIKRKDPRAAFLINKFMEFVREDRRSIASAIVITDESMTEEEQEMALFEGFLKEGYPPEVAEKKAKEWVEIEKSMFKE